MSSIEMQLFIKGGLLQDVIIISETMNIEAIKPSNYHNYLSLTQFINLHNTRKLSHYSYAAMHAFHHDVVGISSTPSFPTTIVQSCIRL